MKHVTIGCGSCHYSENGSYSCNRLMDNARPKIDRTKGAECMPTGVHYLAFSGLNRHKVANEK